MLIDGQKLIGCPVLSLHVGRPIATTVESIIDPNDLKIIAFKLTGGVVGGDVGDILRSSSVREFSDIGMIVDSEDVFVSRTDIIKIDEIMSLEFKLIGLKVVTKKGSKLGKVKGYTVDSKTFEIIQIIVQRPAMKAFIDPELVVSRNEIIEVDDYTVTVKDEEEKIRKRAASEDFVPNFVNPFRQKNLSTIEIDEERASKETEKE